MPDTLLVTTNAFVITLVLFISMIVSIWLGILLGKRKRAADSDEKKIPETSGLRALLFFLLAFTFGMSGTRYDTRRVVVIQEANYIGTAILRADLYPAEDRTLLRKDFKDYLEARIEYYTVGANPRKILIADSISHVISSKIWERTAHLAALPENDLATRLMVPALNEMIDITTTRLAGEMAKVPESILYMLFFLACICAFYSGYTSGRKGHIDWLVEVGFCVLVSLVILFTLDLDRPRRGFINLDAPNQSIIELRNHF